MKRRLRLVGLCCGIAALLACGTPGAPRPPSLQLPRPVDDLAATRKGNKVTLTWTPADENTDGTLIKRAGPTRICRGINDFPMAACAQVVANVTIQPTPVSKGQQQKVTYSDTLASDLEEKYPTSFATYALESFNRRGRAAGLSNQVRVSLAPTLSPPEHLAYEVKPDGVEITATGTQTVVAPAGLGFEFHLYRSTQGMNGEIDLGAPTFAAQPGGGYVLTFMDHTVEWEKTYSYHAAAVTTVTENGKVAAQVTGDDSPTVTVLVQDIFPPAQPVGLQAVASGVGQKPFIDLTLASNQEADLAGYNVYRRENEGEWAKINTELVKAPAFRDTNVEPGHTYFYSVSAVDLRGNEGQKSETASEKVPPT